MVTPATAGDPMRPRKWGRSSLRQLRQRLAAGGHAVRAPTVSRLLQPHDDALRVNAKAKAAGSQHPDRDPQFQDLAAQKPAFAAAGQPIISVDTKKQAWIGDFKNAGQGWCQQPLAVHGHDFPSAALARAVPYGLSDPRRHHGAVSGGPSGATPAFAVTAMAPWGEQLGRVAYPQATQLLILGDAGGRKGDRPRLWKAQLQSQLSDGLGLRVTGCHDPTGCAKWNPIAPRWFSQISRNWAGHPLRTVETRLSSRRDTTTTTGLQVTASLLEGVYQTGKKVTDAVMRTLEVAHHPLCPHWNDTSRPRVEGALRT